jgi:ABC-type multidrug transport system fused ATPase/permease subunit
MSLFSGIFKYVWPQMQKYSSVFYTILILFVIRMTFGAILSPFYFKKIIDVVSNTTTNHFVVSHTLYKLAFILIGFGLVSIIAARIGRFMYSAFEIYVIRDLRNFAFEKLERNSQTFFSNTFAGGLVTKSRRFAASFETMFDIFIYSFLRFFIVLTGVFIILINQSPLISVIFFGWIIIHIVIVSFFVNKKIKYDLLEAEQDSK